MKNFEKIIPILKDKLNKELPKEKAWMEMSSRFRYEDLFPKKNNFKNASVLLCLILDKNDIVIPFIQRPKEKGPHSKQIGLPGGQFDQTKDLGFMNTALREVEEEIGLKVEEFNVLGKLSSLYIPVSNFLVHPFVAIMNQTPEFRIDKKEVEEVLVFSLRDFLDPKNKKKQFVTIYNSLIPKKINVPAFYIQNKIIWGATAMIMNEFLFIYNEIIDSIP
ncbi:MAG: NUDIX hydrolase [Leptonema sp. (in: bacteria)]